MRIVDFHNHYYPPEYVDALKTSASVGQGHATTTDGNPCVHYPGDYNILVPGHRDIDYRQTRARRARRDDAGDVVHDAGHARRAAGGRRQARAARSTTRSRASCASAQGRFTALATLPLNDPAASVTELERAMKDLGLPGAMVFSNVNRVALADERFAPLWKKADELGAVIYIHPTDPAGVEAMLDYWLMPLVGFLMDTTLAASKLVFSGVVERHPRIRWVLTHLGGAIPVSRRAPRSRLPRLRRLPAAHRSAADRVPEGSSTTTR